MTTKFVVKLLANVKYICNLLGGGGGEREREGERDGRPLFDIVVIKKVIEQLLKLLWQCRHQIWCLLTYSIGPTLCDESNLLVQNPHFNQWGSSLKGRERGGDLSEICNPSFLSECMWSRWFLYVSIIFFFFIFIIIIIIIIFSLLCQNNNRIHISIKKSLDMGWFGQILRGLFYSSYYFFFSFIKLLFFCKMIKYKHRYCLFYSSQ